MTLGDRIRKARKKAGKTQADLANETGFVMETISRYEKGARSPSADDLAKIAIALGTTVAHLVGENFNSPTIEIDNDGLGRRLRRLREKSGFSVGDAAEIMHVPPMTVQGWESGALQPSYVELNNYATLLQISTKELLDPKNEIESNVVPFNTSHKAVVKVLPREFAACCGNGIDWETGAVDFDYVYVISNPELSPHSPIISMTVTGDSMEPYIEEGDTVMFSENPSDIDFIPNGCTVVVNYDGRMLIRGLYRKDGEVFLRAWNKLYNDIHVEKNEYFKICGRVLKVHPAPKTPPMML